MYRLGIWLIAFAFVFNGAVSLAQIDAFAEPATIAHEHDHAAAQDHHHGLAASEHDAVADWMDHGPGHSHHHAHHKCCTICSHASLKPNVVAVPLTFTYAPVIFTTVQHDLVGHFVALDPEIPKTVI